MCSVDRSFIIFDIKTNKYYTNKLNIEIMGIKGLSAYIKKTIKSVEKKVKLKQFSGRRIAIDTDLLITRYYSISKSSCVESSECIPNEDDVIKKAVHALIQWLIIFSRNDIIPVFCFDGKLNKAKQLAWNKRSKNKMMIEEKFNKAEEDYNSRDDFFDKDDELLSNYRKCYVSKLNRETLSKIREDFKDFIKTMGFPVLTGGENGAEEVNPEGEALCASLCHNKYCSAVFSSDTDLFAYLNKITINKIFVENKEDYCIVIELNDILEALELTQEQFVNFCILCGTDYNDNIPLMGPAKSHKLIKEMKMQDILEKFGNVKNKKTGEISNIVEVYPLVNELFESVHKKWKKDVSLKIKGNIKKTSEKYYSYFKSSNDTLMSHFLNFYI